MLPLDVLALLVTVREREEAATVLVRALVSQPLFYCSVLCALVTEQVVLPLERLSAVSVVTLERPQVLMEAAHVACQLVLL